MLANENQNKLGTIIIVEGEVTAEKALLVQELQQKVRLEFVSLSLDVANESLEARRLRLAEVESNIALYASQIEQLKGKRAKLESSKIMHENDLEFAEKDLISIKNEIKLRASKLKNFETQEDKTQNKLRKSARQEEISQLMRSQNRTLSGSFLDDVTGKNYRLKPVSHIQKTISAEPESMLGHRAVECKREINKLKKNLDAVRVEIAEVESRISLKVGALEGLKRYKDVIAQQLQAQSEKVTEKTKAQEGVVDFAKRRGVIHKELNSFTELAITDGRQNYILFSNGLSYEQICGMLGNRYFIEKFEPQVEAAYDFLSSSIKDWLPKFAEDESMAKSGNEEKKAENDNLDLVQKVVNNSIFLGNVMTNDLVRSFSWYLQKGSRGVVKDTPLLAEPAMIALFKNGAKESAGTHFCISEYNKGKPENEQVRAEVYGDCIGIKLTEKNIQAFEKWYNSLGLRAAVESHFSSFSLSL